MADGNEVRKPPLGAFDLRAGNGGETGIDMRALVLSVLWLVIAGGVILFTGGGESDGSYPLLVLLTLILPVALIWVGATAARAARVMQAESERLQAAIDMIRHSYVAQAQGKAGKTDAPSQMLIRKLDQIAAAQRQADSMLAALAGTGAAEAAPRTAPAEGAGQQLPADQPSLALGTPDDAETTQISNADFIRALNFPETAEDKAGFAALRRAHRDRSAAQLVQAAQDVLTLLSQEGIYMDDLQPDMAHPEVWRHFATGDRGRTIAALGGIRDDASLAQVASRMKQDPIFRDAAHHFLRLFDKTFARFEPGASDAEISNYANTRTARAFMLLGRVAGTFD